jgi:hypothetical protein
LHFGQTNVNLGFLLWQQLLLDIALQTVEKRTKTGEREKSEQGIRRADGRLVLMNEAASTTAYIFHQLEYQPLKPKFEQEPQYQDTNIDFFSSLLLVTASSYRRRRNGLRTLCSMRIISSFICPTLNHASKS